MERSGRCIGRLTGTMKARMGGMGRADPTAKDPSSQSIMTQGQGRASRLSVMQASAEVVGSNQGFVSPPVSPMRGGYRRQAQSKHPIGEHDNVPIADVCALSASFVCPRLHYRLLTLCPAAYWPCAPGPAGARKRERRGKWGRRPAERATARLSRWPPSAPHTPLRVNVRSDIVPCHIVLCDGSWCLL